MTTPSHARRFPIRMVLSILAVLLVGSLFLIPTADVLLRGKHRPKQVFRNISSDGKYEMTTSSRVALPANEVTDPSVIVTLALRETATGRELEAQSVRLEEESDLDEPLVIWGGGEIKVSTFDTRNPRVLVFRGIPAE